MPPPEIPDWQPLSSCRVLLAEDVAAVRLMYSSALTKAGADVTTVNDGAAAVAACREAADAGRPFAAVLIDYVMPVMDGAEAAAALRADGFTGMIVGVTAELNDDQVRRWKAAGCDEVLRKGVSLSGIVARVATACSRHRPGN
jgi:polar amino acid transport system substrate-binding protein